MSLTDGQADSIRDILAEGRRIWGDRSLSLGDALLHHAKVTGDLALLWRNRFQGHSIEPADMEREVGNLIVSWIRWADDLGLDPVDCIRAALAAQEQYAERLAP